MTIIGGRQSANKVGIVITDGQSNDFNETVQQATQAKDEGVVLFTLGIGSINPVELQTVASEPNCTHVNVLSGFSEIDSMLYEIKKAACRGTCLRADPSHSVFGYIFFKFEILH